MNRYAIAATLALLFVASNCMEELDYGMIEEINSRSMIERRFTAIFESFNSEFYGYMDAVSESKGFGVLGTRMELYNIRMDNVEITQLNDPVLSGTTYEFSGEDFNAHLEYDWAYRYGIVPFGHHQNCTVSGSAWKYTMEFQKLEDGKYDIARTFSIDMADDLKCDDELNSDKWGFDWMVDVRQRLLLPDITAQVNKIVIEWFTQNSHIHTGTNYPMKFGTNIFSVAQDVTQMTTGDDGESYIAFDYEVSLDKIKKTINVETAIDMPPHDRDIGFYIFKEFPQAFVDCVYEANALRMTVDNRNLPEGLPFSLTVKDFKYIVAGLGEFADSQEISFTVNYDRSNSTANPPLVQIQDGILTMRFPIVSKMSLGLKHDVADFYYDATFVGTPDAHASTGSEEIHTYVNLENVILQVDNLRMQSIDGNKIHLPYIEQRIEAYLATWDFSGYFDEQLPLPNMANALITAQDGYVSVVGDFVN